MGSIPKPVSKGKYMAMKKALFLFLILPFSLISLLYAVEEIAAPKTRTFEFTYSATVKDIPENSKNVTLWLPLPRSSEFQEITNLRIETDTPYTITKDEKYNNHYLNMVIQTPETSALAVSLSFQITRREHLAPFKPGTDEITQKPPSKSELQMFLKPTEKVVITPQIKKLAKRVTKGKKTSLEKTRALYDYVAGFMKYDKSGTGWGNGDVQFCLLEKRGNCSDYHSFYSALAISSGIPTRFAMGFPIPGDKNEGEIGGYHCWAESYVDGQGWIPVDISEGDKNTDRYEYFFGAHDENRVEFTVGRDIILNPKQQGKALNYFIYPYAEVDGKAHTSIERKFYFKDLHSI